jgi:hypothetical protein
MSTPYEPPFTLTLRVLALVAGKCRCSAIQTRAT